MGKCAGANAGLVARRISGSHLAHKTTVLTCCLSASRHDRQGSNRRVRPATVSKVGDFASVAARRKCSEAMGRLRRFRSGRQRTTRVPGLGVAA